MIRYRVRRLLKFRDKSNASPPGTKRKALKRHMAVAAKFAKVFRITAAAYKAAVKVEKEEGHLPQGRLHKIVLDWAQTLLGIISMDVEIKGVPPDMNRPVLFVGNHMSYVDIPLLMASVPVVFVAKEEISKWLVIGDASKKAGTVFVKRESEKSRANAAEAIAHTILKRSQSICIFPSGTTCMRESKPWRHGAFKVAEQHKIPVQPFRITYEPIRKVAYIEKDVFASHLLSLLRHNNIKATIEFGPARMITNATKDCNEIRDWTREIFADYTDTHES